MEKRTKIKHKKIIGGMGIEKREGGGGGKGVGAPEGELCRIPKETCRSNSVESRRKHAEAIL